MALGQIKEKKDLVGEWTGDFARARTGDHQCTVDWYDNQLHHKGIIARNQWCWNFMDMFLPLFMPGNRESRTDDQKFPRHGNTSNPTQRATPSHGAGREVEIQGG